MVVIIFRDEIEEIEKRIRDEKDKIKEHLNLKDNKSKVIFEELYDRIIHYKNLSIKVDNGAELSPEERRTWLEEHAKLTAIRNRVKDLDQLSKNSIKLGNILKIWLNCKYITRRQYTLGDFIKKRLDEKIKKIEISKEKGQNGW